jgi:16S rRNA (cytosine1402-N4)-methyltransferase
VLAGRVTALLAPALAADGAVLVDATLGRAGHARALLEACPGLLLVGIDADVAAIEAARELLAPFANRVTLVHARYDEIPAMVSAAPSGGPGHRSWACSSTSACPRRSSTTPGVASRTPRTLRWTCGWTAPKDLTAADIVNGYPAAELARVLRDYGEERFARRIADAVVRERPRLRSPRRSG